ncbi:hypothetical protein [Staphylococcus phage vB_SsapH-Golestan-100]|nr:hypothetical protein [Staphylococcus phage vB_SsapH-Golestan-100]
MKEELVQKLNDKVAQLKEERDEYKHTHRQCESELIGIREDIEGLLQDYNNTVTLLNGTAYSANKLHEEISTYTHTFVPPLSKKPYIHVTEEE